ncbi:MAG: DNA polymerase III subunit beta [Clostridia bacterium]|nr:DNA polymerase III subunit beta [Clostridia bacterium]MBQ7107057.1 DNA polymerase III subunit beta [Clostridia bacterium]
MKISVEREKILEAVNHLSRIVTAKTSLPVLEGILLSAEQGKLTLISYNLEMGMKKEIYAHTEQEGDIVINTKILAEILRKMNGINVEISTDDRLMCHISSGSANFDIMGMSATDFPEMPNVTALNNFNLSGEILSNMVRRTIFSVAQNEGTRPILTGVKVSVRENSITFVAIDGHRLAIRKENVNIGTEADLIIAGKAISEVIKLIKDESEDINISFSGNLISFNIDGYVFISRLLEGNFVDYEKTIPKTYKQRIFVKTRDIIGTIDRISPVINDAFSTPVRCNISEENILFSCSSAVGRATENFPITLEGEEFEIGLNSRYLLDALKAAETENVKIEFNGATSGVLVKPLENDEFLYMVMPMRLK